MGEGSSFAEEVRGVTNDTIKIGVIIDQTGPAAFVGIPHTEAVRNYFRHVNDQGGINGRKVTYTSTNHKAGDESKFYKGDLDREVLIPFTGWRMPVTK